MLRLSSRTTLFIPLFALSILAPAGKLLAQEQLADKPKPITIPPWLSAIKQFEQSVTYWTSEPNRDTELQLRNHLASEPLSVTPVLRLPSGQGTLTLRIKSEDPLFWFMDRLRRIMQLKERP